MPNPAPRPAEVRRAAPDNLDQLVREAMRGGGTEKLRAALASPAAGPPAAAGAPLPAAPAPRPPGAPALVPGERAVAAAPVSAPAAAPPAVAPPVAAPPPAVAAPPARWQDALRRAAERVGMLGDDPDALREALLDVEDALAVGFSTLPSIPVLPPIRQPWLLVIPPLGDPGRLAASLGVDQATARMLALGRWPRVALRGDSPGLGAIRAEGHQVIARDELLRIGPALGVLGPLPTPAWHEPGLDDASWTVTDEPTWLAEPQGGGLPARITGVTLVVPGEVETRSAREGAAESRWLRKRLAAAGAGTERRVRIADLHTEDGIFRLVEGVTRTIGVPGHDPSSAHRSFSALLAYVEALYPAAKVLEERTCAVGADGRSAWPSWEEHTRVSRVYTGRG